KFIWKQRRSDKPKRGAPTCCTAAASGAEKFSNFTWGENDFFGGESCTDHRRLARYWGSRCEIIRASRRGRSVQLQQSERRGGACGERIAETRNTRGGVQGRRWPACRQQETCGPDRCAAGTH